MQRSLVALVSFLYLVFPEFGQSSQIKNTLSREECITSLSGFPTSNAEALKPSFPTDTNDFTLKYFESGCYGNCPSFTLSLSEDSALFEGHDHVRAKGKHTAKFSKRQFEVFLRAWYDGEFFAMRDDYCSPTCPDGRVIIVSDIPSSSITLVTPQFTKKVSECYLKSATPRPPDRYFALQNELLAFAKAQRWL